MMSSDVERSRFSSDGETTLGLLRQPVTGTRYDVLLGHRSVRTECEVHRSASVTQPGRP